MNTVRGQVPPGYRAVPLVAWSAVFLAIAFPVATALVLDAVPHSDAVVCAYLHARGLVGVRTSGPLPPLAIGLVWPGIACALIVVASGLVRYGRSIMDSTRTLGWGALGLFGLVLFVANGIMVYLVYHGGLGMAVVCE